LKSIVLELMQNRATDGQVNSSNPKAIKRLYEDFEPDETPEPSAVIPSESKPTYNIIRRNSPDHIDEHEEVEESLSLEDTERELIQKALKKHNSRRKQAARELGISERTLYRKIKEYDLR
ncbi:MAG TPA: helix-turn-helix domain-containing protein, partial [Cryomorphaceae bacterium]|nr:helix-turn-helix domain-containing protein [Cryomorphaceae bacterium]